MSQNWRRAGCDIIFDANENTGAAIYELADDEGTQVMGLAEPPADVHLATVFEWPVADVDSIQHVEERRETRELRRLSIFENLNQ
jgi:hypothetical protein